MSILFVADFEEVRALCRPYTVVRVGQSSIQLLLEANTIIFIFTVVVVFLLLFLDHYSSLFFLAITCIILHLFL